MDAKKQFALDDKTRAACGPGWTSMSFIAPTIPKPRNQVERKAREILLQQGIDVDKAYTVHIYDVIEAVERAVALSIR